MFRLPTASSLERALACTSSVVLPQIFSGGEDAERGSAIGAFARDILAGEPWEAMLERVPRNDWRATCRALDFRAICGDLTVVRAEVAYAVDPERQIARQLGLNLGRRYPPLAAGEFCGTNDLEGRKGSLEVVCDLKSGREVTSCAVNPQMLFHALARYLVTGACEIEGRLLYVRADGRVFSDTHLFKAFELERFADRLAELVGRISEARGALAAGAALTAVEGSWCRYCPAYSSCPAKVALARAMISELSAAAGKPLSPEEGGRVWMLATEAAKLAESVKQSMNGLARQVPLLTRPGKVVREIESHSTKFAEGAAIALLREKGATQAEIDCLYVESPTHPVREVNEVSKKRRAA